MAKPKKDRLLTVRFTEEEWISLTEASDKDSRSLAEQARYWALLGRELDEAKRARIRELIQEKIDSIRIETDQSDSIQNDSNHPDTP